MLQTVVFSPDGGDHRRVLRRAYGLGRGVLGGVLLWDRVTTLAAPRSAAGSDGRRSVTSVAISPDGKTLAAGYGAGRDGASRGGGVLLWDTTRRSRLQAQPLDVPEGSVASVAFSRDGKTLAAGYGAGKAGGLVLWNTARRSRLHDQPLAVGEGYVTDVAFSPDGITIAACYGFYSLNNVASWRGSALGRNRDTLASRINHFRSPKGNRLRPSRSALTARPWRQDIVPDKAAASYFGTRARRSRLQAQPLVVPEGPKQIIPRGRVASVAFTPDGVAIAACYGSFGPRWRDALGHGRDCSRFRDQVQAPYSGRFESVAFSPDGRDPCRGLWHRHGRRHQFRHYYGGVVLWDTVRHRASRISCWP